MTVNSWTKCVQSKYPLNINIYVGNEVKKQNAWGNSAPAFTIASKRIDWIKRKQTDSPQSQLIALKVSEHNGKTFSRAFHATETLWLSRCLIPTKVTYV